MYHYLCTIFELYSKKCYLELNVKVILYKLNTSRLLYDILYQNLVTMCIGNLLYVIAVDSIVWVSWKNYLFKSFTFLCTVFIPKSSYSYSLFRQ